MTKIRTPGYGPAGIVFIAAALLGWSAVPLFLRYFTPYIDGWTANGWRYGISAIVFAPILVSRMRRGSLPPGLWRAAIVPSLFNACGQCFFAWSPYFIDPALLTFMLRFQIIFIALGAYLFFAAERSILRSGAYWLGVFVVVGGSVGTALLGEQVPRGGTAFGIGLAVMSGLFFSGYSLSVRYYMQGVNPVMAFAAISQYTAAAMVTVMLLLAEKHGAVPFTLPIGLVGLIAASGLVGIAISHVFYYSSIARLGVAVSAGVILLQPFTTGAGSYFLFEERLTIAQWASGITAVGGAVLMLATQRRIARAESSQAASSHGALASEPEARDGESVTEGGVREPR